MITFIDYQYKGVGGVGQLVVNTTLELNRRGKRSKVYCYQDSYEYRRLKECNADFVFVDSGKVSIKQVVQYIEQEDVIVLTTIMNTPIMQKLKCKNIGMLFYSVHPDTFFCYPHVMNHLFHQKEKALELIEYLDIHNALYFMDWPNVKAVYDKGLQEFDSIRYLPVPVYLYSHQYRNTKPKGDYNITYIGRGNDVWKVYPLIKLLRDLNSIESNVRLSIITDDNSLFQQMIKELIPRNRVPISYYNNLYGEKLDDYLYKEATLHVSMGTSALEGAKLGIPTVLIDYSKKEFPEDYQYRWMYECEGFCLAGEIKDGILPYKNGRSLYKLLQSIEKDDDYEEVSELCRQYVLKNHSIQSFVDSLELACKKTQMTTKDYCNTRFSRNMRCWQFASNIKHSIMRRLINL